MIMVNIADAKAKLSEYVEAAGRGETVVLCRHNRPVAELKAIEGARVGPRDLTPMFPGEAFLTEAFFEPMTETELEGWYGPDPAIGSRVAETQPAYGKGAAVRSGKKKRRS
jgi:antitoxin (DNA-binding transcriptional repressor) of toxin-antitoxin stability system